MEVGEQSWPGREIGKKSGRSKLGRENYFFGNRLSVLRAVLLVRKALINGWFSCVLVCRSGFPGQENFFEGAANGDLLYR